MMRRDARFPAIVFLSAGFADEREMPLPSLFGFHNGWNLHLTHAFYKVDLFFTIFECRIVFTGSIAFRL
jgi:hypothetical protein